MYKLNKYFPHITQAILTECELLTTGNVHFPHLNTIFSSNIENITPFIQANPQIHDLRLYNHENCTVNEFLEQLANLEILSMFNIYPEVLNFDKTVRLNNLRVLATGFGQKNHEWNFNPESFICDRLERLVITIFSKMNGNLIKFIIKFSTVRNLTILPYTRTYLSEENLMEIGRGLPLLEKVCLRGYELTINEIVRFIGVCKNLNIFCCIAVQRENISTKVQELISHLGEDWIVFTKNRYIHRLPNYQLSKYRLKQFN